MDKQQLLKREFIIDVPQKGYDHCIKSLHFESGEKIGIGKTVCTVEFKTKKTSKDGTESVTLHSKDYAYPIERYGAIEVGEILVAEGASIEGEKISVFSYSVEETIANLLEPSIREACLKDSSLYMGCEIPEKKLSKAIEKYASNLEADRVLFLYDGTLMGSAKEGFIVTDSAFYFNKSDRYELRFNNIDSWEVVEEGVQKRNDFVLQKNLAVVQGEEIISIPLSTPFLDWEKFAGVLRQVVELRDGGMTKDVDGLVIIQDMPEDAKASYAKAIVWMTFDDDNEIDAKELAELQVLMTQLEFSPQLRLQVRLAVADAENLDLKTVIDTMMKQVPSGSEQAISISLVKDMLRVYGAANQNDGGQCAQICQAREILGINEEQFALIQEGISFDRKVLSGEMTPKEMEKKAKELAAHGAAVGVPIAALYLSGSVIGLGATGITSGLASLGFGGVLGLSSMVTGIGVVIVLGVLSYKGVRWITGANNDKQRQFREVMLQEAIRNHQKTIGFLGEDLACFAQEVISLVKDVAGNQIKIEKLSKQVTLFSKAMKELVSREKGFETKLDDEQEEAMEK